MQDDQPKQPAQPTWQFHTDDTQPEGDGPPLSPPATDIKPISWSASEFVAHTKSPQWYMLLGLAAIVGAIAVYLLTSDKISVVMVVVVAIFMGVFAGRKPRTLEYKLDTSGVHIGQKLYAYNLFRSFCVVDEDALSSVSLMPLRRFMPTISIYYEPKDEQHIVDVLGAYLPFEDHPKDAIDKFMHKIKF